MKTDLLHLALVFVLAASMAGCSLGAVPPAEDVVLITTPISSNELEILSTFAFTEPSGRYNVVGEIQNDTAVAITSVELTIEIRDASGSTLLKDGNGNPVETMKFSPLIYTLAPGQQAPFSYSLDTAAGMPASYNVTVTASNTGSVNRADVAVENAELYNDGSGMFYLSGKLVNRSSQWAHVNSLAGAGRDANGLVTADWTATYASELAPAGDALGRDRTPFNIGFPVPQGAEVTAWETFMDVDLADPPAEYPLAFTFTKTYFDSWDVYHVVGTLTNNSPETLHTLIVGGLYADDGTTLDATWAFIPIFVEPGMSIPFDMSTFSNVNWNLKHASRVSSYSVQVDPYSTSPSSGGIVALTTANDQVAWDGADWTFNGSVTNNSGYSLSGETVIVGLYDAQGNLIATSYTYLTPEGDMIADGQTVQYEVKLYLDPSVDAVGYTYKTFVQGDVK
jgi:hypothetical protein